MFFLLAALVFVVSLVSPTAADAQIYEIVGIRAQGMAGAFVAVADDASTTWWNPAGLSSGGSVNTTLETGRREDSSDTRTRAIALTVPSLGLSYYRLALSEIRPPPSTESEAASRQDQGVLSEFGVTVGQSIGGHLVLASTLKLVHAIDHTTGDLDAGAMAMFGSVRLGLSVKNLTTPEFTRVDDRFELPRQARAGVSFKAGSAKSAQLTVAADADLTTTPTRIGDERHFATGAEALVVNQRLAFRTGVGFNTIGETRRSGSVGGSVALGKGSYVDVQLTRGDDDARNGWGFSLRVTF